MEFLLWFLLLGAFAGTAAGLLGIGGGLLIVPVMVEVLQAGYPGAGWIVHVAVGTSLATIVVTAIAAVLAHHRRGAVLWPVFWRLTAGIIAGALLGAWLADAVSGQVLRAIFGVFELLVATQLLLGAQAHGSRDLPGVAVTALAGMVIGLVSAVLGIGGGTRTVPFLLYCGVPIRQAVATSSGCGLPVALAGTAGFMLTGWQVTGLPVYSTGYVYWPAVAGIAAASMVFAPLGVRLAHSLPPLALRRLFAALLLLLGARMLYGVAG